jgi:hypothetical protein
MVNMKNVPLGEMTPEKLLILLLYAWVHIQGNFSPPFFPLQEQQWDHDKNEFIFIVSMITKHILNVTKMICVTPRT